MVIRWDLVKLDDKCSISGMFLEDSGRHQECAAAAATAKSRKRIHVTSHAYLWYVIDILRLDDGFEIVLQDFCEIVLIAVGL